MQGHMNDWLSIEMRLPEEVREAVMAFFFEHGCTGCQEDADKVTAYFSGEQSTDDIEQALRSFLEELRQRGFPTAGGTLRIASVADRDWNAEWKKHFKPLAVSKKFMVKPTWETVEQPEERFVIEIDPKQAFGTGTHATTQLMLRLLETRVRSGQAILDVGTGTGILAIAAAMLGARVTALDNDPVAVAAAQENIVHNRCRASVRPYCGALRSLRLPVPGYDVILANITRKVILSLMPDFLKLLKPGALLILSGILREERDALTAAFSRSGQLGVREEMQQEEWLGFVLQKGDKKS